jgi:hypothetical protein
LMIAIRRIAYGSLPDQVIYRDGFPISVAGRGV